MNYVFVGKFFGTHGLKGEIKLHTNFKYVDNILKEGFSFYIGNNKAKEKLNSFRYHKNNYLVSFYDLLDINLIEKYINKKVYVLREDLNLDSDQLVIEDYFDDNCYYNDKFLGVIEDVIDTGSGNNVFVIKGSKELLIPVNDNFIKEVKDKNIYFKNMEGFIDED